MPTLAGFGLLAFLPISLLRICHQSAETAIKTDSWLGNYVTLLTAFTSPLSEVSFLQPGCQSFPPGIP